MNESIILVESGATKSDWRLIRRGNELKRFSGPGMNVSTMPPDRVESLLSETIPSLEAEGVRGFYLYTAGVVTPAISERLKKLIVNYFPQADIEINDDLTGAARAALGRESGLVAILGTGSNCCFYDGVNVRRTVYSGGYVLGDEGSAATLGKLFLADFIKGLVPEPLAEAFAKEFDASYSGIVEGVYRSASPSAYLGSLAPFLLKHAAEPYAKELIESNFRAFIQRSLLRSGAAEYPVGIVGGMGWAFRDILRPLLEESGIRISRFLRSPIDGLCEYHSSGAE